MINNLNEDMFFHIVNYLNIDDIYNLRAYVSSKMDSMGI